MNRLIKRKFRLKYITLIFIILMFVPLAGYIVNELQTKNSHVYLGLFIIILAIIFILNFIYNRFSKLNITSRNEFVKDYLTYFVNCKYSYLEYTEAITWFSKSIHHFFIFDTEENTIVNKLHLVLRPNESGLCCAINHRRKFVKFADLLLNHPQDNEQIDTLINSILTEPSEKEPLFPILHDKNIHRYAIIFPLHFLGCLLLTKTSAPLSISNLIGNLLLCIPTDILWILIYWGIIKDKKPYS